MAETVKYVIEADISDFVRGMIASSASAEAADKKIRESFNRTDRKAQTMFGRLRKSFDTFDQRLDRSTDLVRDWNVAMRSVNTTTLVIGATTASGAVLGLAAAASQAVAVLYTLPAAIISIGAILATARVGFGGIGNAVKALDKANKAAAGSSADLSKQLAGFDKMNVLQEDTAGAAAMADLEDAMGKLSPAGQAVARTLYQIGQAFNENVAKPVQEVLLGGLAPALMSTYQIIEGPLRDSLITVAGALNTMFLEMLRIMTMPFFLNLIKEAGDLGAYIVSSLTPALEPLAAGIASLFTISIPYIQAFVDGISGAIIKWGEWMQTAAGQNAVKEAIDQSIQALQVLGSLFGAVFGAIGALFKAAGDSIFYPINALTELVNRFREWLGTAEGVTFVTNLMEVTTNAIHALSDALAGVGSVFAGIINWFASLDEQTQRNIVQIGIFVGAITGLIGYVGGLLSPVISMVGAFQSFLGPLTGATGAFGSLSNILKVIGGPIGIIVGLLIGMYTQSESFRNAINGLVTTLGGALMPIFQALVPVIGILFEALGSIVGTLGDALAPVITALLPIITILGQVIGAILVPVFTALGFIIQNVIVPVIQFVLTVVGALATFLAQVFVGYIQLVGAVWSTIFTSIGNVAKTVWDGIVTVWNIVATFFTGLFQGAWDGIVNIWNGLVGFFQGVWDGVAAGVNWYINFVMTVFLTVFNWLKNNIITPIGNFFTGMWNGIITTVNTVANTIKNVFNTVFNWLKTNIITPIGNFFKGLWDGIGNGLRGLSDIIKNIFNGIVNIIKTPINWIIDGFNTMIRGVNSLKIPDWVPGLGGKSLSLPTIPKLAMGGIITSPTLAMVGEAGTEAVMPLENNTGWIDDLASKINGAGGGAPISLTVQIGEETIVDKVVDLINDKTAMSGRNVITT